jgi:hypothetical protein
MEVTCWTASMRRIIGTAVVGSSAFSPVRLCPGVTVSRLVPSRSSSASSCALLDWEMPSTATMAAMPMAIPRADSAARSRRVRRPVPATPRRSRGRSRPGLGVTLMVAPP